MVLRRSRVLVARTASRLATIVAASFLIFAGLSAAPGDPVRAILGPHPSVQAVAHERHVLGLDRPLLVRYWDWLSGAVHGDFGTSLVYKTSVGSLISPRIGTTLLLVGYSLVIILMIGLTLGILGGTFRRLGAPVAAVTGRAGGGSCFCRCTAPRDHLRAAFELVSGVRQRRGVS